MSDNALVPNFIAFFAAVQDGSLAQECNGELIRIQQEMKNHQLDHGGKPKARLTITFDFVLEKDGTFEIYADTKTKLPVAQSPRTILWSTRDNRFSRQHLKQQELFPPRPRAVPSGGSTEPQADDVDDQGEQQQSR